MESVLRQTGIKVVPQMSWGTHFCTFYETKVDLLDTVVPFFRAGLVDNEFCIWVVSKPFTVAEAKSALLQTDLIFSRGFEDRKIEILDGQNWYFKKGAVDVTRIIDGWQKKLHRATKRGCNGLRVSGNAFWLATNHSQDFFDYERAIDEAINGWSMIALCTYPTAETKLSDVLDVARAHQFAVARRNGAWQIIHAIQPKIEANLLTSREKEVLGLSARGRSASEIAMLLHITKRTVHEHVQTATRKLGASNRTQAVVMAIRNRLISV